MREICMSGLRRAEAAEMPAPPLLYFKSSLHGEFLKGVLLHDRGQRITLIVWSGHPFVRFV
jgi:hypothetical protein